MKKLTLSIVAIAFLAAGSVVAQNKIIIKTTPAVITKQGDLYVVPADLPTTTSYYYYTDVDKRFVCSYEAPTDLASIQATTIGVTVGGAVRNVYCYPESYFVIQP